MTVKRTYFCNICFLSFSENSPKLIGLDVQIKRKLILVQKNKESEDHICRNCLEWLAKIESSCDYNIPSRASVDDGVSRFIVERCTLGSGKKADAKELYSAYQKWCKNRSIPNPIPESEFDLNIRKAGIAKQHEKEGLFYYGIGLDVPFF